MYYALVQVDWAHDVVTVVANFTDLSDKGQLKKTLVEKGYVDKEEQLEPGIQYFKKEEPGSGCPPVEIVAQDNDFSKLL